MRRLLIVPILFLAALSAFGHAGEVHKYMGTIDAVQGESFTLAKTDGTSMQLFVSPATVYQQADGAAASRADLAAGKRAVVTISTDGKTATLIKFAASKKK